MKLDYILVGWLAALPWSTTACISLKVSPDVTEVEASDQDSSPMPSGGAEEDVVDDATAGGDAGYVFASQTPGVRRAVVGVR